MELLSTLTAFALFCMWLYPWESRDVVAGSVTPSDRNCTEGLCPGRHQPCATLPGVRSLVSLIAPKWAKFSEEHRAPFQVHRELQRMGRKQGHSLNQYGAGHSSRLHLATELNTDHFLWGLGRPGQGSSGQFALFYSGCWSCTGQKSTTGVLT